MEPRTNGFNTFTDLYVMLVFPDLPFNFAKCVINILAFLLCPKKL